MEWIAPTLNNPLPMPSSGPRPEGTIHMTVNSGSVFPPIHTPLYEAFDEGGGGGGDLGGGDGSASPSDGADAGPAVVSIPDDNALVSYPGAKEPVPFKNLRSFQSQWTKEAQRRAQIEKELEQERTLRQRYESQAQQAQRTSQGAQQQDVLGALRQLPYLDGEAAAQVVQGIEHNFRQRDQMLMGMANVIKQLQARVGGMYETHTNSSFDAKISKWLTDGGYPQEYSDLAKEIYLAYEGDDLDSEFPNIFAERVGQIEKAFEARRAAKLAASRRNVFVPGKGGVAGPSKPGGFKGNESAKEIADSLWSSIQTGEGT